MRIINEGSDARLHIGAKLKIDTDGNYEILSAEDAAIATEQGAKLSAKISSTSSASSSTWEAIVRP